MTTARLGQTVIYRQGRDESLFNGHKDHPAIVTDVHSEHMVNLKVLFDCGPVHDRTSVLYRPEAVKREQDHLGTWDFD